MRYQIQTLPIIEAFQSGCDCPFCALHEKTDSRNVLTYLNDAVMEPDFRLKVNKYGFCPTHMQKLNDGKNKLSLGLQLNTHTDQIIKDMSTPKSVKAATLYAKKLKDNYNLCVICQETDEIMLRYAYTTVQMYAFENGFKDVFKANTKGFCMPHFALLLENAPYAKKEALDFIESICQIQRASLVSLNKTTERFTLMFDYNSLDKSFSGSEDAIKNAINKIKGNLIK